MTSQTPTERALLRLADAMPGAGVRNPEHIDGLDVLVAAAWGACLGVVIVHTCKVIGRHLSHLLGTS